MRAGGACAVQQTLTSEAASVLKHSLTLARRRGHAQVTPLHVAATLLSSRATSLLKRACLKSQPLHHQTTNSHPLHCRALELCFNVALNRLPTTPTPLLHSQPSLSNALVAALKRAQAHQRRGCIEQNQQQPLLAIKVELEQLILSILDDPSVSRVMREAGFSSTAVKNNLEESSPPSSVFQCYGSSGGVYSSPCSPSRPETNYREAIINPNSTFWKTHFLAYNSDPNPFLFSPQKTTADSVSVKEDVKLVLEVLLGKKKRRNTVIVGDSVAVTDGVVSELMGRVERGDVPDELKSAHFIRFQFTSVPLRFMKREEVEMNLSDLKRKVEYSLASRGGGVIIYAGDLKWTVDTTVTDRVGGGGFSINGELNGYNPVDHLVAEIGRLVSEYSNLNAKVWLMGSANYQTYMRCQMKQPSLEIQWSLQAVSVPSGGLGLSLHATSVHDLKINLLQNPSQVLEKKPFSGKEEQDNLTCCEECISKYEKEAGLIKSCNTKDIEKGSTPLPYWLQSRDSEAHLKDDLIELRRKWNRMCHSQQHQSRQIQNQITSPFLFSNQSSSYPWWTNNNQPNSIIFPDSNSISFSHSKPNPNTVTVSPLPRFRRQQSCHIEFSFSNGNHKHKPVEPNLDSLKNTDGKEIKITLALGSSQLTSTGKLIERRSEICKQLQENVPWQSETIPSIVDVLIQSNPKPAKETWLLIQGNDSIGKRRLARGIAESVFGSADLILHINMRENENKMSFFTGTLERSLRDHEKLVVLVENVDFSDAQFLKFLADGLETGKFGESRIGGEAIFILTKGDSTSYADGKDMNSITHMKLEVSENFSNSETPKSEKKRRSEWEWDSTNKAKSPRIGEKEKENSNGNNKKEFARQLSSNTLDLNIKADEEDDEKEPKTGDVSPISSDLTREMGSDLQNPHGFFELIKNKFDFNRDLNRDSLMKEMVLSKIRGSFEEVCESEGLNCLFNVEERVLEEVLVGSFVNILFEKWLREVFQTTLQTVKIGGKDGSSVRLCLGGEKGESSGLESNGYMGSRLPKKIKVYFIG